MRVASGGIRTHDTLHSGQMLYQLSYQGSSADKVRIKHLICLYEQANLTHAYNSTYMYIYSTHTLLYYILYVHVGILHHYYPASNHNQIPSTKYNHTKLILIIKEAIKLINYSDKQK